MGCYLWHIQIKAFVWCIRFKGSVVEINEGMFSFLITDYVADYAAAVDITVIIIIIITCSV